MLNRDSFNSQARNPRALIKINDIVVDKIINIEYIENNYYQPDSFRVTLPLYNLHPGIDIEYWGSQPAILVEIFLGFPSNPNSYGLGDLQSMTVGAINNQTLNIFQGTIDFDGFDLSKKFIDNKTVEKYQNLFTSDIATKLAIKRGLTPVVTPTKTYASFYYTQDYVQLGNEITEWDLLTYLAQKDGFQVFVRGTSLYYQPRVIQSGNPYIFQASTLETNNPFLNGESLIVARNYNYAQDVVVNITSMSAKWGVVRVQAKGQKTHGGVRSAAARTLGQTQTFDYSIPGLSKQQATERAQKILEDISLHERILDVNCPGDNLLRKDTLIQLKGVSESIDQTYYPDTITRTMDGANGNYSMNVRAKNHSPQSTVII